MAYDVGPQTVVLFHTPMGSWLLAVLLRIPHLKPELKQGGFLGFGVLPTKLFLPFFWKVSIAAWFLQWVFCAHK